MRQQQLELHEPESIFGNFSSVVGGNLTIVARAECVDYPYLIHVNAQPAVPWQ